MGQATKRGMYCTQCDKPVAAEKTTHGVRNLLALPTLGVTAKRERWHCPDCGGKVEPNRFGYKWARERKAAQAKASRRKADRSPAKADIAHGTSEDIVAQIKGIRELHEAGAITDKEFAEKKAELLSRL